MTRIRFFPILVIGTLAGCAVPRTVEILEAPPSRPYTTVGPVTFSQPYTDSIRTLQPNVLDGLRAAAAEMGANAVILKERRVERVIPGHYTDVVQQDQRHPLEVVSGTAIRYDKAPPAPGGG